MLKLETAAVRTRAPFDEECAAFLDALSKAILRDPRAKRGQEFGDVVTFAFWCRRASVLRMRERYGDLGGRIGRGLVFHIAPSNVAVNFAYSLAAGLLAGNANVVRLPSKEFAQVDWLCEAMASALETHPALSPCVQFVRYGHERAVTDELSAACDVRVIWGGDETIREIRRSPLRPRAVEIAFADRYSIAAIDADAYMAMPDKAAVARNFYNDTYLTDQNACTSPRLVVWLGEETRRARELFWESLDAYARPRYELRGVQAVHKLSRMMALAATEEGVRQIGGADNLITRVELESLSEGICERGGHSGFFMEYIAARLDDIAPVCGEKCQTLGYLGVPASEIERFIAEYNPKGVDRAVPIGRTMDFSLVWDGYDLIYSMTRAVDVVPDARDRA